MKQHTSISEEDLRRYRALLARALWREMYGAFEKSGLTCSALADRLGVNKSVISRRLNGTSNMTLEVLSDMARALDSIPKISLGQYEEASGNREPVQYEQTRYTCVGHGSESVYERVVT